MNAPLVVFRADAGGSNGSGHVRRCRALAAVFRNAGWRTAFATDEASIDTVAEMGDGSETVAFVDGAAPPERQAAELGEAWPSGFAVLVSDHYGLDAAFEKAARKVAHRIVAIDDLADRPRDADVLFDSALGRNEGDYGALVPTTCRVLTGPAYALLGPAFLAARSATQRPAPGASFRRVHVGLGGVEPGPVIDRIVAGLAESGVVETIEVVLGMEGEAAERLRATRFAVPVEVAVNVRDMADRLARADLAVGAGGSSAWERCALGLPTLMVTAYENQRQVARGLAEAGAVLPLGWHDAVTAESVAQAVRGLAADPDAVAELSRRALALCDGRGAERTWLASDHEHSAAGRVTLRLAEPSDAALLYDWQSAPETRRYAKQATIPTREEHEAWFARRQGDPDSLICMIACDGKPRGCLRLDRMGEGRERLVSIYLAPGAWGQGIATAALDLARRLAPGWRCIAEVLPENDASHRLFRRAGYHEEQPGTYVREAAA